MIKKFLLIYLAILSVGTSAQTNKLTGSWLLTKATVKGKTVHPYQIVEMKKSGKFTVMGMELATWKLNSGSNSITLNSKLNKDFNGNLKIVELTDEEMILTKGDDKYFYKKYDKTKIAKSNGRSNLSGLWETFDSEYPSILIKLELPDSFTVVQSSDAETDKSSGNWIFLPEEHGIIFSGFSHLLRGKFSVDPVTFAGFVLKSGRTTLTAKRVKSQNIERLTFKEKNFPEDSEPDQSKLPWKELNETAEFLKNISSLSYTYGKLVNEFNTLIFTSSILSKISVDISKPSIKFTNYSIVNGNASQYSEKYKDELSNGFNLFFPQEEPYPYRILGTEKITSPAGTFNCTVIEGFDGESKIKYWMINKMPGIYAKIIKENKDPFGKLSYTIQELEKINYK